MWLVAEVTEIKDENNHKRKPDILFSTDCHILRVLDENGEELFNTSKLKPIIKEEVNDKNSDLQ